MFVIVRRSSRQQTPLYDPMKDIFLTKTMIDYRTMYITKTVAQLLFSVTSIPGHVEDIPCRRDEPLPGDHPTSSEPVVIRCVVLLIYYYSCLSYPIQETTTHTYSTVDSETALLSVTHVLCMYTCILYMYIIHVLVFRRKIKLVAEIR